MDLFQGNELRFSWAGPLLGTWPNLSHLVSVCQRHSSGPISHDCKGERCLVASGAICLLSVFLELESFMGFQGDSKVQIPELFEASGQPLWLSRKGWGAWCWEVPQIEMEMRIHTNPGLVLGSIHWMETRKFWGRCYKEKTKMKYAPSFRVLLAQVQEWYLGQGAVNTHIVTYLVRVTVWVWDWSREGLTLVIAVKHT